MIYAPPPSFLNDPALLSAERIVYASIFGAGLLTTVYAMLNGTVRMKPDPTAVKAPLAAFNAFVVGAALMAAGAVGYALVRYSQLDTIYVLIAAFVAAVAGWVGMTTLMAKWALKGPLVDPHEELEELQGTIATVTRTITPTALGAIRYSFRGELQQAQARSIGGDVVPEGTEVVIEKIENGVADVELWSVVEQRL